MYIFTRTRQARADKLMDAIPAAIEIGDKVTAITGREIYVWAVRFGQPNGTVMWSTRLDTQADLIEANEKMMADSTYLDMAMGLSDLFEGPTENAMARMVSGTPSESPAHFIATTQATIAGGKYREAMEWGVEIQQYVGDALGRMTMFGTSTYGGFGDVIWLLGSDSAAEVDEAADWMASDAGYLERVAGAGDLFLDGSGQQGLIERLNG